MGRGGSGASCFVLARRARADARGHDRRGKGWLMIASSHWQLLGYRVLPYTSLAASASAPPTDPEFVVTYFAATLFTPAGLDIYARHPTALGDEYVDKLTRELVGLGGECERLCTGGGMFRIPHD